MARTIVGLGFLLLLVGFCGVLYRFSANYSYYQKQAGLGMKQLSPPSKESEAIVVLAGDVNRIPRALALLKMRDAEILIISGAGRGISLTDVINQQGDSAQYIHESWQKIILESDSGSTWENAEKATEILTRYPEITQVILVTSDYHMARSLGIFRRFLGHKKISPFSVTSRTTSSFAKVANEFLKSLLAGFYLLTS